MSLDTRIDAADRGLERTRLQRSRLEGVSMTRTRSWQTVYYFEVASWLVALLVALGWIVAAWRGAPAWRWDEGVLLAGFGMVFAGVCMSHPRTYKQRIPWLATAFSVSGVIAMVIVFSRW